MSAIVTPVASGTTNILVIIILVLVALWLFRRVF